MQWSDYVVVASAIVLCVGGSWVALKCIDRSPSMKDLEAEAEASFDRLEKKIDQLVKTRNGALAVCKAIMDHVEFQQDEADRRADLDRVVALAKDVFEQA